MIWVPGGTGLLGRAVCDALEARGHDVCATGRSIDIRQADAIAEALTRQPDAIVNCAAWTDVDGAEAKPAEAAALNTTAPGLLGAAAHHRGIRLVHVSTDYVFGGEHRDHPLTEATAPAPINVYGRTKLEGEQRLLSACPDAVVVRTSWLHGRHGPCFVATMLRLMQQHERITVVDDQHGRPTWTGSLARALADLAVGPATSFSGLLHYADAGPTTWHGFAVGILEAARDAGLPVVTREVAPVGTEAYPRPAPRPTWSVLDTTRASSVLPWPIPAWQHGLDQHLRNLEAPA